MQSHPNLHSLLFPAKPCFRGLCAVNAHVLYSRILDTGLGYSDRCGERDSLAWRSKLRRHEPELVAT